MSNAGFQEELISDTESGSSDEATGSEDEVAAWIGWFCSLKGNEFFCEVDEEFIQDDFNLSGLSSQVRPGCFWFQVPVHTPQLPACCICPAGLPSSDKYDLKHVSVPQHLETIPPSGSSCLPCFQRSRHACMQVSYYDYALDLILDADSPSTEILTDEQHELVESAAETLYGLIHVRHAPWLSAALPCCPCVG